MSGNDRAARIHKKPLLVSGSESARLQWSHEREKLTLSTGFNHIVVRHHNSRRLRSPGDSHPVSEDFVGGRWLSPLRRRLSHCRHGYSLHACGSNVPAASLVDRVRRDCTPR